MKECWSCKYFVSTDDYGDTGYCKKVKGGEKKVNPESICNCYKFDTPRINPGDSQYKDTES